MAVTKPLENLPVFKERSKILTCLSDKQPVLFEAPTGSGKSTVLPQVLLEEQSNKIWVLQARKLAVKSLSYFLCQINNSKLGESIGYQTREEKCFGPDTRVIFITYGVFLRYLSGSQNRLSPQDHILFDEYHERSLSMDLCFDSCLKAKAKVWVLSASLSDHWKAKMTDSSWHKLQFNSRQFPVETEYLPAVSGEWLKALASAFTKAVMKTSKDILIFLPGLWEIQQARKAIREKAESKNLGLHVLHAGTPTKEQNALFQPSDKRRVILSTNVAETSITLPSLEAVIDSGLEKKQHFHSSSFSQSLFTQSISLSSAKQRQGRAGRTGPGYCLRLWHPSHEKTMPADKIPELVDGDLRPALLFLAQKPSLKIALDSFVYRDDIDPQKLESAKKHCEQQGFIKNDHISLQGQFIQEMGSDYSLSHCLYLVKKDEYPSILKAMVLLEKRRNPRIPDGLESDLDYYLNNWQELIDRDPLMHSAYQRLKKRLDKLIKQEKYATLFSTKSLSLEEAFIKTMPWRLGKATSTGRMQVFDGRVAQSGEMRWHKTQIYIALSIQEKIGAKGKWTAASLVLPLTRTHLYEQADNLIKLEQRYSWEEGKLFQVEESKLGAIDLDKNRQQLNNGTFETASFLFHHCHLHDKLSEENQIELQNWFQRCRWYNKVFPEDKLIAYEGEILEILWLEWLETVTRLSDLNREGLVEHFKLAAGWQEMQKIEKFFPKYFTLKNRRLAIEYNSEADAPKIGAYIQWFYDLNEHPTIASGKLPLLIDLWAPNRRTAQLTKDLPGFWENSYPAIKKDLTGRYPKHDWR